MKHFIHRNYREHIHLYPQEITNLYRTLNAYGKKQITDAAQQMFIRSITPLNNHWDSYENFLATFQAFYKMSKNMSVEEFADHFEHYKIPTGIEFSEKEYLILSEKDQYLQEACYLLGFIDSLADSFEYEVLLMTLGYPPDKAQKTS